MWAETVLDCDGDEVTAGGWDLQPHTTVCVGVGPYVHGLLEQLVEA